MARSPFQDVSEQRRRIMGAVRRKSTGPEVLVRRAAHELGLRFRLHRRDLPGTPDLVFPKHHVALFVHGCFWHRHEGCRRTTTPKTHAEYWNHKFAANVERDRQVTRRLEESDWRVEVIWECVALDPQPLQLRLRKIFGLDRE